MTDTAGLLNPEDGGYPFIEFDELDLIARFNRLVDYAGFSPSTNDSRELFFEKALHATSAYDLRKAAKGLISLKPMIERQQYLMASPAEREYIDERLEVEPTWGVSARSTMYVPKYTCGWAAGGASFTPVRPGNMTNAIAVSEAVPETMVRPMTKANGDSEPIVVYRLNCVKMA